MAQEPAALVEDADLERRAVCHGDHAIGESNRGRYLRKLSGWCALATDGDKWRCAEQAMRRPSSQRPYALAPATASGPASSAGGIAPLITNHSMNATSPRKAGCA